MKFPARVPASLVVGMMLSLGLAALSSAAPSDAPAPWQAGAPPWAPVTAPPPGESTVVRELDVVKRLPGPAIWKVSKGDAQVFILGALTPLPHSLRWDTTRVENALDGADALLLPPRASLGVLGSISLFFDRGALMLSHGRTLDQVLPPRDDRRFHAIAAMIHKNPRAYERWKPAVAGVMLLSDFLDAAGLSKAKPGSTVVHLAEARHVRVDYVGNINLMPYAKTVTSMSDAENLACFEAALDDIDRDAADARPLAQAWADADLKTLGAHYTSSLLERCLSQAPSINALVDRGTREGVSAINTALSRSGRTVAVIDLNFLLRRNGVLDRLKAEGADISVPN